MAYTPNRPSGQAAASGSAPVVLATDQSAIPIKGGTSGTAIPDDAGDFLAVRPLPQKKTRWGFGKVIANGVEPTFGTIVATGAGQTVNQTGGNLVITSGTTARSETILRSGMQWRDAFNLRWSTVLSQRIANNNFFIEMVDVIGDGLAYTINSATSITVTIPSNPFTAQNIGQSMTIGNFNGSGTFLSGTAVIASVAGNDVTYTVAGFAAGTGTCSVFGWNYHRITYTSTVVTNLVYQGQRNGWPGTAVTATTNTTVAPGHIGILNVEDNISALFDQLRASAVGIQTTMRAQQVSDMPDDSSSLYLQIRSANGSTAPATTTTWTVAFVDLESYAPQQVSVTSARPQSYNAALPVQVMASSVTQAVSGSLTSAGTTTNTPVAGTVYTLVTAATTNAAIVKAAAGSLFELTVSNLTAATIYVKLFNKATAPTVGTDVPIITVPVIAGDTRQLEFGSIGKRFAAGIAIATTAAAVATDTAAVTAGAQISATYV